MQPYKDLSGRSGVKAFEITDDSIKVQFKDGSEYLYDSHLPGKEHVDEMKKLAHSGIGLTTFINKVVRSNYTRKLK